MFLESTVAEGPQKMRGHLELDHTLASGVLLLHSSGLGMEKTASFSLPSPLHFFFQCPVQARELSVPFSVKLPASKMAWPVPCPFYALTCSSNMGGNTAHLQLWSKLFQNREKAKNISVAGMIKVDTMAKIRSMLWKNIWCSLVAHFCTVTHYDFWR